MVTFRANIYGPLDGGMVTLYNFAAGSFHTNKMYSELYSIEIEFYFLKPKIAF